MDGAGRYPRRRDICVRNQSCNKYASFLLILSECAQSSKWVLRETKHAVDYGLLIPHANRVRSRAVVLT